MVSCRATFRIVTGPSEQELVLIAADPPIKDIHTFYGVLTLRSTEPGPTSETSIPLNVENVLWANTVLAAGSAVGLVVYTGKETRAVLNTSEPETKMGTLEQEVNKMAKVGMLASSDPSFSLMADPLHSNFRAFRLPRRAQRIPRPVVHLRLPLSHLILVYHPHQVS